ncbi:hypothetical protein Nepgr_017671 [Nepenthes gracilis]|uniref:Dof zinc finger protein n=1 Tax=Nepenthes gracilis TaxID=150966 RepID=A0AAD3SPT0_NEPGR|nr:hypothetical protein Nepgr_017671 [Nepenthes gracilis]
MRSGDDLSRPQSVVIESESEKGREMDQLGGGGGEGRRQQQQQQSRRRGMEPPEPHSQQQHPPHQTCPRCSSNNTKFCYYNNYNLSQPRYFCKGCRRYWTLGGTLRNVPVGGGCRKSKRPKVSPAEASASASSGGHPAAQPQEPQRSDKKHGASVKQNAAQLPAATNSSNIIPGGMVQSIGASSTFAPLISPFYPGCGGGFLSSLAAIQAMNLLNPPLPQPPGGDSCGDNNLGNPSNLGLIQGFTLPPFGIQSTRPPQASNQQHQWLQHGLMANAVPPGTPGSDAPFWITGSSSKSSSNTTHAGPSSNPNQWPDFSGCGDLDEP